jgi:hypothetical protein
MVVHSVENQSEVRLNRLFSISWIYGSDLDVVSELAEGSCQTPGAMLLQLGIAFHTLFDESNSLMQDLPNHAAEPMGDGPNGRLVPQSRQQPAEYRLDV